MDHGPSIVRGLLGGTGCHEDPTVGRRRGSILNGTLSKLGLATARTTEPALLEDFVARLRPRDVGVDLVRIGGAHDGGYLIPDDLDGIGACFSPGVDDTASFEEELMARGIGAFLADASVDGPPSYLTGADFTRKHLGSVSDELTITLDDWVMSKSPDSSGDLMLQMDIEGAEYACLLASSIHTLRRFRIVVVELHQLSSLGVGPFFELVRAAMARVLSVFDVVHVHPNNCCGIHDVNGVPLPGVVELTLIRKDRGGRRTPVRSLPHPCDAPNLPLKKDIRLPSGWLER